jgi:uncharacterized protein YifN (PemK superfamily)
MVHSAVPAGTVLFLDFDELNLAKPEFEGAHPVMVLSPESKQRDGTAIVIPITSAITNARNIGAVELTNETFVRTSPTGRSFAICDKPITVALSRLDYFRAGRRPEVNYQPNYQIKGEDLANARMAFFRAVNADDDFKRLFANGALARLWSKLKERQRKSGANTQNRLRGDGRKSTSAHSGA